MLTKDDLKLSVLFRIMLDLVCKNLKTYLQRYEQMSLFFDKNFRGSMQLLAVVSPSQ